MRPGTLSHEVGHAFLRSGATGQHLAENLNYAVGAAAAAVGNTTDDVRIEAANWGGAAYGRDWVDNYRAATTTTHTIRNAWAVAHAGHAPIIITTTSPRSPTTLDLFREGARQISAQRR